MPIIGLCLAFLAGIILADSLSLTTSMWWVIAGVWLLVTISRFFILRRVPDNHFIQRFRFNLPIPIPVMLLTLFLGGARYQAKLPYMTDLTFIAAHNDTDIQMVVTGVVDDFPDEHDRFTYLRVESERMHTAGELDFIDMHGTILVSTPHGKTHSYGDRVIVRGFLETPQEGEDFSYKEYLKRQGVYTIMNWAKVSTLESGQGNRIRDMIFSLKEKSLDLVYQLWPDPEASLFSGILLGVETSIPEDVQEAFKETGTSHIIAISGFNIAIVSGLFARSFGRVLGLYRGAIVALIAIAIYTILVGADAAVVRAAVMGGLSLGAGLIGRRQYGPHALSLTAAVMAFIDPHILWDVGFQLSFAATLGLVLYAEPLQEVFARVACRWLPEERAQALSGPVGEYFLFTFAAQVTTLPIMAYHFGTISWVSFLANPIILPVQPPIMILGGLSLILGLVWFPLGKLLGIIAWPFVLFTIRIVELFGRYTSGSLVLGDFSLLWVIGYFMILLTITIYWTPIRSWVVDKYGTLIPEKKKSAAFLPLVMAIAALIVVTWRLALTVPDGNLHMTLLDVGSGASILIETPGGRNILVNGGPSTNALSEGLGRRLRPLDKELDWLIVASAQSENIAALPRIVERYPPTNVLWAGLPSTSREADHLRASLTDLGITITNAQPGQSLDLGGGASLRVLTAGSRGAILLLEWDQFQGVLPLGVSDGDLEKIELGSDLKQVPVLLLADSGYTPTNPQEWLENLKPQLALLSVAPDDRDGLPDGEVLDALAGATLLRTDQNGWVHITTDGQQMWVEAEK